MFGLAVGLLVLIVIEFLLLLFFTAWEWPEAGVLSFVAAVGAADFFYDTHILATCLSNPHLILGVLAGYLAIGTAWSFFKWLHLLRGAVNQAREDKSRIYEKYRLPVDGTIKDMIAFLEKEQGAGVHVAMKDLNTLRKIQYAPSPSDYKRAIMSWIATWPFSVIWFIIDEPVKMIWEWCRGSYQRLSDHMWKGIAD